MMSDEDREILMKIAEALIRIANRLDSWNHLTPDLESLSVAVDRDDR